MRAKITKFQRVQADLLPLLWMTGAAVILRFMPTLNISSGTLYYLDAGKGEPLVLVHGFPLDGQVWERVAPRLADKVRVLTPDLPGFGRSFATGAFTMDSLADALVEMLDQLKIERATFAGLSMGGYVLQSLVRRHPMRVSKLIFVDTRANADDEAGRAGRDKMIELVKEKGTAGVVEQMLPKMLAPATFAAQPEVVSKLRDIMLACPPGTIANACAAMRDRADFTPMLASLPCPLQVIVGQHDAIASAEVARAIAGAAKGARLDVIEEAGHISPLERPDVVAEAMLSA